MIDPRALAQEIAAAHVNKQPVTAPTLREGGLDLATAYLVERELKSMREAAGHRAVGVKVGFANKAMWRALKLDTLVWAHMYDDTVRAGGEVSIGKMVAPKIEPEIVFKLRAPITADPGDAAGVLAAVEWIALGFEIIDCVYPDWKITPIDFVASYGLHAGLVIGAPTPVSVDQIPTLVDQLAGFTLSLQKNGEQVAQGSGKNSLKNPALCLGELSSAMAKAGAPLSGGDVISSGTLTEAQLLSTGETYTAIVAGLDVAPLTTRIVD